MNIVAPRSAASSHAFSEAEWRARVDLAAFYRLVHHYGMSMLVFNHITARAPGPEHHFLINEYGLSYEEVTPANLVKVDLDGNVVDGTGREINPAGYIIHSCIHRARKDVACVVHTHSRAGVAVSCLKEGLVPLNQEALQFHGRIAYHDYEGMAVYEDEQKRLVANLGDKDVMILRNHGLLATGRTIAEAFRRIYYLEIACRLQLDVLSTGRPWAPPAPEVCDHTAKQWQTGAAGIGTGSDEATREWPSQLRLIDRKYPGWQG
ncbi:MAG: class II aldolase/adducin family protein [Rhodospirillaceae bacterium]|nr:class II aldolase/adducin family protein [Rhodospirillaceae bacterium]